MRTTSISLVIACLAAGCGAPPVVEDTEAALSTRTIFNSTNNLIAVEGSDCVSWGLSDGFPLQTTGAWVAPSWVDGATIIYNGFNAIYNDSNDHHLRVVEAQINHVAFGADRVLRWSFEGNLDDKSGNRSRTVCYYFTVVGWNKANVAARTHTDYAGVSLDYDGLVTTQVGRGVRETTSQPADCPYGAAEPVAILPRGSEHLYVDSLTGRTDHHVLRVGHFVSQDRNPGNCVNYLTRASLQDNNTDDLTQIKSRASFLGGASVRVQGGEDFTLPSRSGASNCIVWQGGEQTEHVRLTNVGFEFALPMLTGWEVYGTCNDEHVKAVGASIRNIKYDICSRTLDYDYVSVLGDNDYYPAHASRRAVTLLGLNRAANPFPPPPLCGGVLAPPDPGPGPIVTKIK